MRFKFVFSAEWPSLPQCLALCLNIIIHSFIPSRMFVSPSDPTRSMSKNAMSIFLRQLITKDLKSGAVSSSVPPRAHDTRGIATSLNYYSNLSLSAINEAATWKSNRVFAMRYLKDMSATRS